MKARSRWRLGAGSAATAAILVLASGCAVDLGTIGGQYSAASDINDRGDIVGAATTATLDLSYPTHAWFRPADGAMTVIDGGAFTSSAAAVDPLGTVVGTLRTTADGPWRAFRWTATDGPVQLGSLGGPASAAADINASGWIVGRSDIAGEQPGGLRHGFVRDPATGTMSELANLPGYDQVQPMAINDDGLIVGAVFHDLEYPVGSQAVMWAPGTHAVTALPGLFSTARGVNQHGDIVGSVLGNAVIWDHATHTATELATLSGTSASSAVAINDDGTIVGTTNRGASVKAITWPAGGSVHSLGGLGGLAADVTAINAAGVAVGSSQPPDDPWAHATRYDP